MGFSVASKLVQWSPPRPPDELPLTALVVLAPVVVVPLVVPLDEGPLGPLAVDALVADVDPPPPLPVPLAPLHARSAVDKRTSPENRTLRNSEPRIR
jgi:hypothetical protein